MEAMLIITAAVKVILGEQYELPESGDDRYFLGDTILRISEVLARDGPPTIEMLFMSIEIGELTLDDCQDGHITFTSHDQHGRRDANSLGFIANRLFITAPSDDESPKTSYFGRSFAFEVCQACPAFIAGIHEVHDAGFTADTVNERADAYWLATFGF